MKKAKYFALALTLAGALIGCGGGGGGGGGSINSSSSIPELFDEFYGAWKLPSGGPCYKATDTWFGDRYYANNDVVRTMTATTVESKQIYYSDAQCTVKAGTATSASRVVWSAGNVAGRSNVARLQATLTGYQISADGGSGLSLSGIPQMGKVDKLLMDVSDGKLCVGSDTNTVDKDGYPSVIDSANCWSR